MGFEKACRGIGVTERKIAVSGGTGVFALFLKIGSTPFTFPVQPNLCCPLGGRPFRRMPGKTPEQVLSEHGLKPAAVQLLDREADVTLTWNGTELAGKPAR
jgi:hypothetical protein